MTGWYETWREVKRRAQADPEDEFLQKLLGNIQEKAVHDYVESHAGLDSYEDPIRYTREELQNYLDGLDEIRGTPKAGEVEKARSAAFFEASKALEVLSKLPWSGTNTYGEALEDGQAVIAALRAGKPAPKLERFRCPSEYKSGTGAFPTYRCSQQLPHDGKHFNADVSRGTIYWTDEQSVNPPTDAYGDSPQPESGEVQDPAFSKSSSCRVWQVGMHARGICIRPVGHAGTHRRSDGTEWLG